MFRAKTPIVVMLGVHRSGTSLSARIFSELGLRLGDQLLPGHRDNPEGFWEHGGIIAETREMEKELGVNPFSGDRLVPTEGAWWKAPPYAERYRRLKDVIEEETAKDGLFGFKDPRTLQLLPMWQSLFKELKLDPRYVLLLRHPEAVAGSMKKRNKLRLMQGQFIWAFHISYGLQQLDSPPVAIVHYENWFSDLSGQLAQVAPVLEFDPTCLAEAEKRVREFLDTTKSHFHGNKGTRDLIPQANDLYQVLLNGTSPSWKEVEQCSRRIQAENKLVTEIYEGIGERARRVGEQLKSSEDELAEMRKKVTQLAAQPCEGSGYDVYSVEPRPAAPYEAEFPDLMQFVNDVNLPGQKLKVCIATEDIVGPIRNGGIGTTYTHLSRLLAEAGHEVTIAYLRGNYCQNESIRYWIDWYEAFGVTFIPVDPNNVALDCAAPRWMRPMFALYQFLKKGKFDLVHASEWRGAAFMSLLAKRQGIALEETFFCVKASSPYLWNREYGYHVLDQLDELPKMHAERRSIELADMVISGSRYLLCWMLDHGYKLPEGKCYVQPNVMVPLDLDSIAQKRRKSYGKRIPVDEIVFFGRLEYRKGLDLFFEALERLANEKVLLPKITLMGKYGERIPSYPELTIPEFIKFRSKKLPTKVQVLSNYGNEEALRYLLGGRRLAVMPSRIENSTLCVYETAYYGIPFIASDRGGTAELVHPDHREKVLTDAHPVPLAEKLGEMLSAGGFVARPSFFNNTNLGTWLKFHGSMAAYLKNPVESKTKKDNPEKMLKLSLCQVVGDNLSYAKEFVSRLGDEIDGTTAELVLVNTRNGDEETESWVSKVKEKYGSACIIKKNEGMGEQHAQNAAAGEATGEILLFVESGSFLKSGALPLFQRAVSRSGADVLGSFYERADKIADAEAGKVTLCGGFDGDHSGAFFSSEYHSPVIAIRKSVFENIGGFREDYRVPGALPELVTLSRLKNYEVDTIPHALALSVDEFSLSQRVNLIAEPYRTIRPFLEIAPECYKRILLTARSKSIEGLGAEFGLNIGQNAARLHSSAKTVAGEAGGSPGMRNLGWSIYWFHIRVFRTLIEIEIKFFRLLLHLKRKLLG